MVPLQIVTLGLLTLLLRTGERHFPRRMDEDGVETRGGKRIRWAEITRAHPVRYISIGLGVLAEEILFDAPTGRFSLHSRRILNYKEVAQYAWQRVPPSATKTARWPGG
jgi:hypothetical protein